MAHGPLVRNRLLTINKSTHNRYSSAINANEWFNIEELMHNLLNAETW